MTAASHTPELSSLQRAAVALKEMRARLDAVEGAQREPIAIVGMGGRFPGAGSCDELWELLDNKVDAVTEIPEERWSLAHYYDPNPNAPGKMNARHGGFLADVDQFDAAFFGIPRREAVKTDPQQRLLLEVSWEALENAGHSPADLAGSRTGTYIGINQIDYALPQFDAEAEMDIYTTTGNGYCFSSGRVSYTLGLHGPNMAVDTACSSSLVAVHLACQALRARECEMALAGGVQLNLVPTFHLLLAKTQSLSPSGRCNTFSDAADGLIMGEGCAVIVLKRLSDALAHGDNILAVIRGSAVNHGGAASGITVPNELAQEALIRQALEAARVDPADVDYVETHGTGTLLGDPIEVGALGSVFGERDDARPLVLGALKTNIGHLDAAAGIAGLIKAVLAVQHERIPANLHLGTPNPRIDWDAWPVRLPVDAHPWPCGDRPRIAGVSSFGFSGTNVHVVLAEAPEIEKAERAVDRPLHLFTLSAMSPEALRDLGRAHADRLDCDALPDLGDLCFTANAGRSHFAHRLAIVAESTAALRAHLSSWLDGEDAPVRHGLAAEESRALRPAFVFGGSDPAPGEARQLYSTHPGFRATVDRCFEILGHRLEGVFDDGDAPAAASRADRHTARFILDYAVAQLWLAWGVAPGAVTGSGVGAVTAACVAGVFRREEALPFVVRRAALVDGIGPGRAADDQDRLQAFAEAASRIDAQPPRLALLSDVTGEWLPSGAPPEGTYWRRQVEAQGPADNWLAGIVARGLGRVLAVSGMPPEAPEGLRVLPGSGVGDNAWPALLETLAQLHVDGVDVEWEAFDTDYGRRRVPLPTYPFQRQRYWFEPVAKAQENPPTMSTGAGSPAPASGNGTAPVAGGGDATDAPALTRIMARQLQTAAGAISGVVAQQLDYLRATGLAANGAVPETAAATGDEPRLDSAPPEPPAGEGSPAVSTPGEWALLLLSADDVEALDDATSHLVQRLRDDGGPLAETATGLRSSPARHHRRMLVARDPQDAAQALADLDPKRVTTLAPGSGKRTVAFLFPGVGDHYQGMARGLYESEPLFHDHLDRVCELVSAHLGEDLRTILYPAATSAASATTDGKGGLDLRRMLRRGRETGDTKPPSKLERTIYNQPAVFAVEYALAQLWMGWGVTPQSLVGYSVGEYVAACLAGVMTLEDAVKLLTGRARLIDDLPAGAMLAVPLPEADLLPLLADDDSLSIAIISTPGLCVVGGEPAAVEALGGRLQDRDVLSQSLPTTHAFHSKMLTCLREPIEALAASIALSPPRIPFLSNVTGTWIAAEEATSPAYWASHTHRPVRFADCIGELMRTPNQILLEVGPGQNLGSFAYQHDAYRRASNVSVLPTLRNAYDGQPDRAFLLNTLGKLWLGGVDLDWDNIL